MLSLTGISPEEGERLVPLDSSIEFTLLDDGTGINISTLIVDINGSRALTGITFEDGFEGVASEVTPSGANYMVVIDPEASFSLGSVIPVQIQAQDLDGLYFNITYAFKTVPREPVLVVSSPIDGGTIVCPQNIYLEFEDIVDGVDSTKINISINQLDYVVDGVIESEPSGPFSTISSTTDGAIVRLDPVEPLRDGKYRLVYSVGDTSGNLLSGVIDFKVIQAEITLPTDFPQTGFLGFFQGIKRVSDVGCGDSLLVEWNTPIKRHSIRSDVFVLVYENEKRLEIFDDEPAYLATSDVLSATVSGLDTGVTLSYSARAMETFKGSFDPTGMVVEDSVFVVPPRTTVVSQISDTETTIRVDSVAGYPSKGFLRIGHEIIRYNAISEVETAFLVPSGGRGLSNTSPGIYLAGDEVRLFFNCQDSNTVIVMATPTYQDGYASGRAINSEGILVTDYSDNDMKFFQGYDFCGYHRAIPQNTLQGVDDCPSYLGGEFNGLRGMNIYDRMLNREEVLLDQVGEPVVLLKRIWSGEKCSCATLRENHPKVKSCPDCFGTTFARGYSQFLNLRRDDKRIMVSFKETTEDLKLGEFEHLEQEFEPPAWTLSIPAIRDRDILVRFDFTDDVEYIYEVLNTSKEKLLYKHFGRQNLALKRMDKTDILYTLIKSSIINNDFIPSIS
jgi:hypothetical protein